MRGWHVLFDHLMALEKYMSTMLDKNDSPILNEEPPELSSGNDQEALDFILKSTKKLVLKMENVVNKEKVSRFVQCDDDEKQKW